MKTKIWVELKKWVTLKPEIWVVLRKRVTRKIGLTGLFLIWCLMILGPYSQIARGQKSSGDQPNVTKSYEAHAERIEDMFKWGIGGVFSVFALVSAFQIINAQYVRDEITKSENNINEAVDSSKVKITEYAKKTEENLAKFLSLSHKALLKTIDLNEARIRLTEGRSLILMSLLYIIPCLLQIKL